MRFRLLSFCPSWPRRFGRAFMLLVAAASLSGSAATPRPFPLGFSVSMFTRINENDAKASIAALALTIAHQRELQVTPMTELYTNIDLLDQHCREGVLQGISVSLPEYWILQRNTKFSHFVGAEYDGETSETYIVLTHADSSRPDLASLAGQHLATYDNNRMTLALTWLDVELARVGLPDSSRHFGRISSNSKPSKTVLDVYFRKAEACIISERILRTVVDMNPSIMKSLRRVASSPPYVPALLAFSASTPARERELITQEILKLHETPAGQQVLMMFRMVKSVETTADRLASSLALLDEHAQLCPEAAAARYAALQQQRLPSSTLQ